jgi:DNA repair photolyase
MTAVDIGTYDTCPNGCKYCYANHSPSALHQNLQSHDPDSPLLCGQVGPEDVVQERKMESSRQQQTSFF